MCQRECCTPDCQDITMGRKILNDDVLLAYTYATVWTRFFFFAGRWVFLDGVEMDTMSMNDSSKSNA